jgi:hypothetical protein
MDNKPPARDEASVPLSPSKPSRSALFKRPKWKEEKLKEDPATKADAVDIFRRAEDTSRVIEQRKLEKKERRERKAERRKSRDIKGDSAAPSVRLYLHGPRARLLMFFFVDPRPRDQATALQL